MMMIKSLPHSSLTAGSCCYWWDTGGGDNVQAGCARRAFWDEVKHCAQLRDGHCSDGRQERENKFRLQLQLGCSQAFMFRCCQQVVPLSRRGRELMSLAVPHMPSCSPDLLCCCCCCPVAGVFFYQCDISAAQTSPASLFLSSSPPTLS